MWTTADGGTAISYVDNRGVNLSLYGCEAEAGGACRRGMEVPSLYDGGELFEGTAQVVTTAMECEESMS